MTYTNTGENLADFVQASIRNFADERRALPTRVIVNPTCAPVAWLAVSRMGLWQIEVVGDFFCPASELQLER